MSPSPQICPDNGVLGISISEVRSASDARPSEYILVRIGESLFLMTPAQYEFLCGEGAYHTSEQPKGLLRGTRERDDTPCVCDGSDRRGLWVARACLAVSAVTVLYLLLLPFFLT